MKTAGDILSNIFDEGFVKKANGYSKLFSSWKDITAKNKIAAAADHSRIKDIDKGILIIEMDHPGWKQILQTKQSKLLNDFRIRFPEMEITGISLMLGNSIEDSSAETENTLNINEAEKKADEENNYYNTEPASGSIDDIQDEEFKQTLKSLGQTIADREGK